MANVDTNKRELMQTSRLLRLPDVLAESGLSRSTLYLRVAQGLWTKPVQIGQRAVAWPAVEVAMINSARISGRTHEEIRVLVTKLETERLLKFSEIANQLLSS